MFYVASKLFWFVVTPAHLLLLVLLAGTVLLWFGRRRAGTWLVSTVAVAMLALAVLPIADAALRALEQRFPGDPAAAATAAGIVVLGGGIVHPGMSRDAGRPIPFAAVHRAELAIQLARAHPALKVVISGGDGSLIGDSGNEPEAVLVARYFEDYGIARDRLIVEARSRNTRENAVFSAELARPDPAATWLLVTTAYHMPRAVGTFRAAGWRVAAAPAGRIVGPIGLDSLGFDLWTRLQWLGLAVKEYIGLAAYYASGYTASPWPAPDGP